MKTLELCCGRKSFSKVAAELGYDTVTVDIDPKFEPTVCCDLLSFDPAPYVGQIDILWMSPPCREFSMTKTTSQRDLLSAVAVVRRCVELLNAIQPKYFVFENPVGYLDKSGLLNAYPKHKVSYCKYGFNYRKNTHIWTNIERFVPKLCSYDCDATITPASGKPYHKEILSGQKSKLKPGQDRKKSNFAVVPRQLVVDLIDACHLSTL